MKILVVSVIFLISVSTATSQTVNSQFLLLNTLNLLNQYAGQNGVSSQNLSLAISPAAINGIDNTNTEYLINSLDVLFTILQRLQNSMEVIRSLGNQCTQQLDTLLNGLVNMDGWALRMLDASAKIQPGFLEGNIELMGHYEECIKIDTFANATRINGKYCTSVYYGRDEKPIDIDKSNEIYRLRKSYGFCVPAACNESTLNEVIRILEEAFDSSIHFQFHEEFCRSIDSSDPLSVWAILAVVFFAVVGIIIILSTLYDIYGKNKNGNEASVLVAFSFYSNGKNLFSTRQTSQSIDCLNGMKVISILWIIGSHRYMYSQILPLINAYFALQWTEKIESSFLTAGNMAVDTFFLISGLLLVYVYLNHKEKGQETSIIMFYVHRILRLTPSLAVLVLVYATLLKHLATGPMWFAVYLFFQRQCESNWWGTLLYIQNYAQNATDSCAAHTWYLAVDTQLYFLSPLLLIPLTKWPKCTISGITILTFLCSVYSFEISWYKKLDNAFYSLAPNVMKYLYIATQSRAAPWLLGIILGYAIYKCKNKVIKMHRGVVGLLWLVSLGAMMGIILFHYKLSKLNAIETSIFNGVGRTIWSLGASVVIFLCATGYGGVINVILSCSIFRVLVRLTYSMYLLHIMVIVFLVAQVRTAENLSTSHMFYLFWGDFAITLLVSIVWTLAFESPIIALEKIIFGSKKKLTATHTDPKTLNNNINVIIIDDKLNGTMKRQ